MTYVVAVFDFVSTLLRKRTSISLHPQYIVKLWHPGDDKCNGAGVCKGRNMCLGNNIKCVAKSQCHTAGVCQSGTGLCSNPPKLDGIKCDDKNANTSVCVCVCVRVSDEHKVGFVVCRGATHPLVPT